MKNVTYINAGAGSGKTYTLTERLADLIEKQHINPEQVILTTFTTKAAEEFKEKAKAFLYERGLFSEAARLDQALVGTVHSVANSLINKFWFKLGLPPRMGVMAEEDVDFFISQSLGDLPDDKELEILHGFVREFDIKYGYGAEKRGYNYDLWKTHLKEIIDYATNYEITDFTQSETRSIAFIREFVHTNVLLQHTTAELHNVLKEHKATLDGIKESGANNDRKEALRQLEYGVSKPTVGWYKSLASLLCKTEKKNGPLASAILEELNVLWNSKFVFDIEEKYIRLLFALAKRWQVNYADYKKQKRVLDYNDMEKYLLRLLTETPSVIEELRDSYCYLFVDEFQDCSPIQVKIFDRLSDIIEGHTYWVGDYKQSIYGFRGSDIQLVKAVVDQIESGTNGCDTETLKTSYRSLPDIVDVCNEIFKRTFAETIKKEENIVLNHHRENKDSTKSLRYWQVEDADMLAAQIAWLISHEHVSPKDVAVICRKNSPLNELADILQGAPYCVPVSRDCLPILDSNAAQLVLALLGLVISDSNTLAKATIAWLTVKGFNTAALIDDKLRYDSNEQNKSWEYLNDTPLVVALLQRRSALRQQSISAMVETLIIELGLYDVVKQWPDSDWSASCLDALITAATAYEQHSLQMGLPATVSGYMDYLTKMNPTGTGNTEGVQLHTYHSCKGLQWKHVILLSLNENIGDEKKVLNDEMFGINFCHTSEPTKENPFPEVYIRVAPFIYGGRTSRAPEDIENHVKGSAEFTQTYRHAIEEANRLLYVGMTRAADVLTLAIESPKRGQQLLCWPLDIGLQPVISSLGNKKADLLGVGVNFENTTATEEQTAQVEPYEQPDAEYLHKRLTISKESSAEFQPRNLSPSELVGTDDVLEHTIIGKRIEVRGRAGLDYARVGDCIHQIYCGVDAAADAVVFTKQVITAYGLTDVLPDAEGIVSQWNALKEHLTTTYGEGTVSHEYPFQQLKDGHIITGSIDMIWQTKDEEEVLIDFKSNPMSEEQLLNRKSKHFVGFYGGQLDAYETALKEAGHWVQAKFIYYPVSGLLVELGSGMFLDDKDDSTELSDLPLTYSDAADDGRKTYILRWNPDISSFKMYEYRSAVVNRNGFFRMDWSIYEHEEAHAGDRFYMLRVGKGNTGIIFRGVFITELYIDEDWAGTSKKRYYVELNCEDAIHPDQLPAMTTSQLQEAIPEIDWMKGHSGQLITDKQVKKLDEMWNEYFMVDE